MPKRFGRWFWLLPLLLGALCLTRVPAVALMAAALLLGWLPGRITLQFTGLPARYCGWGRTLLSIALSLAIMPTLLNPIWHFTNQGGPLLFVLVGLNLAGILARYSCELTVGGETRTPAPNLDDNPTTLRLFPTPLYAFVAGVILLLAAFATAGSYWPLDIGRGPSPAQIHDYIKHHAVLYSMQERPLPLGNPFYAGEAAGPTYYYHFFYLLPATLRAIAPGIGIGLAFGLVGALVAAAVAGLVAILAAELAARLQAPPRSRSNESLAASPAVHGAALLGLCLSSVVGGLDIIPVLLLRMRTITLDAWADTLVRIHNLLTQMVWTPQNMLGVLIALLATWLLGRRGWWGGWLVLGPLLGACLLGTSIWIALVVLPALVLFVLLDLRSAPLRRLVGAGAVAVLMLAGSWSTLAGYQEMSHRFGKSLTTEWPYHKLAFLGRLVPPGVLANLLDYPWMLVIEFGALLVFPLLLTRAMWHSAWRDAGLRLLLISSAVSLVSFVVVRSHYTYNDFGPRVILIAMAAGAVLGSQIISGASRTTTFLNPLGWRFHERLNGKRRRLAGFLFVPLLLLGLPVGLYQAPLAALRRHLPLTGKLAFVVPDEVRAALAEAPALRFIRNELPATAVIQAFPGDKRVELLQLIDRQIGISVLQEDTMVFYPVDLARHKQRLTEMQQLERPDANAAEVHALLQRLGVTHVLIGPIERKEWKGVAALDAAPYFKAVFSDATDTVLQVLP